MQMKNNVVPKALLCGTVPQKGKITRKDIIDAILPYFEKTSSTIQIKLKGDLTHDTCL